MAIDLNTGPNLPPKTDYGIGCIGAGFIMRDVHLAAYREAGASLAIVYPVPALDALSSVLGTTLALSPNPVLAP